ncbi:hypothetical protein [Paenibacillus thermotolerans]|uniref:hypothetical protein n=1 Tax=Paenibacillus thermotolerans TaxID=3027807 RepID=UPI002367580A|nr:MULTISPECIES: hypothetical protein [unclassified Paenibacillus]
MKRFILLFAIICFITVGCNSVPQITSEELEKISVHIIEEKNTTDGKFYTLKLYNKSKFTIRQNNVYISYLIVTEGSQKGNDFKVLTRNNRLDIKPNENVTLTAHVPKEMFDGNRYINMDEPYVDIIGYIEELKGERQFHMIEPLKK